MVNAASKTIYYASNEGNPLEQQIWQVGFDGQRKQLSSGAGFHEGNFAPSGAAYVDSFSTIMEPPRLSLCETGGKCKEFWTNRGLERYKLRAPEQVEAKAADGTTLYATLLLPASETKARASETKTKDGETKAADAETKASIPLIVNPYGGPGPQTVVNKWSSSLLFDEVY